MPFRVSDLPALLRDFGETWTFGALTATGILDDADEVRPGVEGFEMQGRVRTVLFRATDFPLLADGSALVGPDGVSYRVRGAPQREPPDGALKRAVIVVQTT